ncbi:MAG: histidine kinase dimerization/phospho-acceptor domain-containing protein [Bacteroidota bacterium]
MGTNPEVGRLVAELQIRLSSIKHDANNPLAIISGNAQLLLELAGALDLGAEFTEPLEDIEEACQRVSDALNELTLVQKSLQSGQEK